MKERNEQPSDEKCINGTSVTVSAGVAILDDSNAQMIPEKDSNYEDGNSEVTAGKQVPELSSLDQLNVDYFNKWMDSLQS